MTERLYYSEPGLRSFAARLQELKDGGRRAYLDRTAFYPTSGGQPHDLGSIDGVPVVDVVDEGERVAHLLAEPVDGPGRDVDCVIDWTRRFDHMQQHTGQHLLSAVCDELLGLRTVSVHFGADSATLDVATSGGGGGTGDGSALLSEGALTRVEWRVNELVAEGRAVTVSFEEAAEVAGLRKASDRSGTLRIVTIEGVDRSACGGTHVQSTSEIGPVLLRGQERVRSAIRIEFVCGLRALRRARRDLENLSGIARANSASVDDIATVVERQSAQLRDLQAENRRLREVLAGHQAESMYQAAEADREGLRWVVDRRSSGGADESRALALAVIGHPRAVFIATSPEPPSVLLATSADSGIDAGKTLRPLLELGGGRGGGSPRLAQGSAPTAAAVDRIAGQLVGGEPAGSRPPRTGAEEARHG